MPIAADLYYHAFEGGDLEQFPLVLIHGAGGNHLSWPAEIRRLPGQRVYAPDLPGHGRSGGHGQQTIQAYADSLLGWLDAMGLHRAIFIGHSMGGAIALTLALNNPERTAGLGLVASGARLPVNVGILNDLTSPTTFIKATQQILEWSFSPLADPRLVELAGQRMAETRPSVLHGDLLACTAFDVSERLGEIEVPALVVCGNDDRMTPLRFSQFLGGAIPGAVLEIIPRAGHMVMLEQPQAVAAALSMIPERFLARVG